MSGLFRFPSTSGLPAPLALLLRRARASQSALLLALVLTLATACGGPGPEPARRPHTQPATPTPSATPTPTPDPPHLTGTLPDGQRMAPSLTFIFDQPMRMPLDADGRSTAPIRFTPALDGTFTTGTNFIGFEAKNYPMNEVIQGEFHPGLRSQAGQPLPEAQRRFARAAFDFEPRTMTLADQNDTTTTFALSFSMEVTTQTLLPYLKVTDREQVPVRFALHSGTSPLSVHLALPTEMAWPAAVQLEPGAPDARGLFQTASAKTYSASAKARVQVAQELAVTGLNWMTVNKERQMLRISFSLPVEATELAAKLSAFEMGTGQPVALPITFDKPDARAGTSFMFYFNVPDPSNIKVRVQLADDLATTGGLRLNRPFQEDRALRTALGIYSTSWETEAREGLQLWVRLTHPVELAEFREKLQIEPALPNLKIKPNGTTGFWISGDWQLKSNYKLTLAGGLRFSSWATRAEPLSFTVRSPEEVPRYLGLGESDKIYIPRRYGNSVPLETRGIGQVEVSLYRMFPSNIALAIESIEEGRLYQFQERWSEPLGQHSVKTSGDSSSLVKTALALDKLTSEPMTGVFGLSVTHSQGYPVNRLVLMSNIGLLARWQDDALLVFAHDLFTLAPVAGARVTVSSYKNQILASGSTDADGIARFEGFAAGLGQPTVVVAEHGQDYTFLPLDHRDNEVPESLYRQTNPLDPYNNKLYDASIYADRELYRPSETVHLRWIVRQNYGDAVAGAPLLMTVIKPNGKPLVEQAIELSEWGTASLDIPTQKTHETGRYLARLTVPGSENEVGRYEFRLEEFVPQRMKAELRVPQAHWFTGQSSRTLTLAAEQLFGGPAAQRVASMFLELRSGVEFPQWPQFTFGGESLPSDQTVQLGEQVTDAAGLAHFAVPDSLLPAATQPLQVRVFGSVQELGGRGVRAEAQTTWFPSPVVIGIRSEASRQPGEEGKLVVQALAVTPEGEPATLPEITLTFERQNWTYGVRSYRSYREPIWSGTYTRLETVQVPTQGGIATATFNAEAFGSYRVIASSPQTTQRSAMNFFSANGRAMPVQSEQPEYVKLKLDRTRYLPGERPRLRIDSAFPGKALLVLQNDGFRRAWTVDVGTEGADVEFELSPDLARDLAPTAWIEAHMIHAIDETREQVYPFTSFAALPFHVEQPERRIEISLPDLPEAIQPDQPLEVRIQTRASGGRPVSAEVTLAAVDEGIHGITGYRSPNPTAYFTRLRAPVLRLAHYYDRIASRFTPPGAPGDDAGLAQRLGRNGKNWIQTVALWSGAVRTDAAGQAKILLHVPEFNGQLRLDAVAANATATGSTRQTIYVRRPYMLQTSLPRFLLPGDQTTLTATLINTTSAGVQAQLDWNTSGTLSAVPEGRAGTFSASLPAKGEATAQVALRAGATGQGQIDWSATIRTASGETTSTLRLPQPLYVGEPAVYQTSTTLRIIAPGETLTLTAQGFLQDDWTALDLTLGASPILRLRKAFDGVIGYPYGCVEQTTSKLLSLYMLRRHGQFLSSGGFDPDLLDTFLQSGIERLWTMQTASGGLAFWPGGQQPDSYGSLYALHFLTLVRMGREYRLDENPYASLLAYARRIARGTETTEQNPSRRYERAYAVYVLALAGDIEALALIDAMQPLAMPRPGRLLLAAALAINTQDSDRVRLYLETGPEAVPWYDTEYSGSLNSPLRARAVELMAQLQIQRDPASLATLADELARDLQAREYPTTQEQAMAITALSQYLDTLSHAPASAEVEWTGGQASLGGTDIFHRKLEGPGVSFTVRNTGQAMLFATLIGSGVPAQPPAESFARNIAVRRRILTRDGQPATGPFEQGTSYVVELELDCERLAQRMIVADLLPGGFEIENPRLNLNASVGLRLPYPAIDPDHLEIRDDRLILSWAALSATRGSEPKDKHHFYYVVNAVTPGDYLYPGARAELMYDPASRAQTASQRITIMPRNLKAPATGAASNDARRTP